MWLSQDYLTNHYEFCCHGVVLICLWNYKKVSRKLLEERLLVGNLPQLLSAAAFAIPILVYEDRESCLHMKKPSFSKMTVMIKDYLFQENQAGKSDPSLANSLQSQFNILICW